MSTKRKRAESTSTKPPLKKARGCPHIGHCNVDSLQSHLLDPEKWSCSECGSTESVWICLYCNKAHCARTHANDHKLIPHNLPSSDDEHSASEDENHGHAYLHWQSCSDHPLVLEINTKTCFCYDCNTTVSPEANDDLEKLLELLKEEQTQKAGDGNRKKERRTSAIFQRGQQSFEAKDQIETILQRWQLYQMANVFQTWRDKAAQKDDNNQSLNESTAGLPDLRTPEERTASFKRTFTVRKELLPGQTGLRNLASSFRDHFIALVPPDAKNTVKIKGTTLRRRDTIACLTAISTDKDSQKDVLLSREIHNLMRVMWSGKWSVVTPFGFLSAVWSCLPDYHNHEQHDSQEFLFDLLDYVNSELGGSFSKPKVSGPGESIINKLFQGQIVSEVTCESCQKVVSTHQPLTVMCLEVPEQPDPPKGKRATKKDIVHHSLESCIERFFASEDIGDEYGCETCKSKQQAYKRVALTSQLPEILIVVLKRFVWKNRAMKNQTPIDICYELDLSEYVKEGDGKHTIPKYELTALVSHRGARLTAGHYTSYCYNKNISSWIHFNDNRVQVVTAEDVEAAQPYLLFFQRTESDAEKTIPGSPIRKSAEVAEAPPTPVLLPVTATKPTKKVNLQKKPLTLSEEKKETIVIELANGDDDEDESMEDTPEVKKPNSKKTKQPAKSTKSKPPAKQTKKSTKAKTPDPEPEEEMDIEEEEESYEAPPKKATKRKQPPKGETEKPPAKKRRISALELKDLKDSTDRPNVKRSWNAELMEIQTEAAKNVDDKPLAQRRPTRNSTLLHKTVR